MGSAPNKTAAAGQTSKQGFVYLPLLAGWLIPGAGHFLLGKWGRGLLLAVAIVVLFALGLRMDGQLYTSGQDILHMLGMAGDLGNGLMFFVSRTLGLGGDPVRFTTAEYGTKFIVVAGLLNVIAAVDAHNLRTGRKS
jgi:TM2 domain-containing membrane protein YozV